jgi:hypothetical protein
VRRTVLDVLAPVIVPRKEEEIIGEAHGEFGYVLSVRSVCFDSGAKRIRLVLERYEERIHHLDVTASLLLAMLPALERAASLAGDLPVSDEPWWRTCSVPEFSDGIKEMTQKDLEALTAQIKLAILAADSEVENTGSLVAKSNRSRLVRKKKLLKIARSVYFQEAKRPELYKVPDYSKRMLKLVGKELRRRYDTDVVDSIFSAAKDAFESEDP